MELVEIKGLIEIETGATCPIIVSTDFNVAVTFYAQNDTDNDELIERNIVYDKGIYCIIFNGCLYYKFGRPNNETLTGHPYYSFGLKPFSFFELKDSDLIKQLEKIESVHSYYNSDKFNKFKHYILTFHDNMFECVASEFEIREENISVYQQATLILNEFSSKQF